MSVSIFVILLAVLQQAQAVFNAGYERYYQQLAVEAAEAGATYATSCLKLNNKTQTWGPSASGGSQPDLSQATDCTGAGTSPVPSYVYSDTRVRTSFTVGDLEYSDNQTAGIAVIGYAEVLTSTGSVAKTYQAGLKKTVVWDLAAVGQRSTAGFYRTCGIVNDDAYCWGANTQGQLGDGTTNDSLTPVAVKREAYPGGIGSHAVVSIAAAAESNCVIIDTGEVYCWGDNWQGQLGDGTTTDSLVPKKISGVSGKNFVQLGSGSYSMCALTDGGELYCWGRNNSGQVGNNTTNIQLTPTLIGGPSGGYGGLANKSVSYVAPNGPYFGQFMCAVATGKAYCWGDNKMGQLGTNNTTNYSVPTAVYTGGVLSGKTVTRVALDGSRSTDVIGSTPGNLADGESAACALAYTTTPADAKVYCWGSNHYGQLGNNGVRGLSSNYFPDWIYPAPVAVDTSGVLNGLTISEIAVADQGACAIGYSGGDLDTRRVYCWGRSNTRGDGMTSTTTVPVAVTDTYNPSVFANNPISNITGGAHRMCAIANNTSYCWGVNGVGQIGDGTTVTPRRQPTEAIFLRTNGTEYIY